MIKTHVLMVVKLVKLALQYYHGVSVTPKEFNTYTHIKSYSKLVIIIAHE